MKRVAIIPARGGSRRIPRKNIRSFMGKPIIAYSIETAKASGLFSEVFVTTDDIEIAIIAEQYGAHALDRPETLARDEVGTQEVMAWVLRECLSRPPTPIEYACCIYATAPLMTERDLQTGFNLLNSETNGYPIMYSYAYITGWFYWGRTESFLSGEDFHNALSIIPENYHDRWIDINSEEDWLRAEQMYVALHPELLSIDGVVPVKGPSFVSEDKGETWKEVTSDGCNRCSPGKSFSR